MRIMVHITIKWKILAKILYQKNVSNSCKSNSSSHINHSIKNCKEQLTIFVTKKTQTFKVFEGDQNCPNRGQLLLKSGQFNTERNIRDSGSLKFIIK